MGQMRKAPGIALASLVLTATAHAAATAAVQSLVVSRSAEASDCPDARTLAAAVERLNGAARIAAPEEATPSAFFTVRFVRRADTYSAIVEVRGALVGERTVDDAAPSCDGLVDAVALTLSLLLDELPKPSPAAELAPRPEAAAVPRPDRRTPPSSPELFPVGRVAATGGVLTGIVRPVAPAIGLAGEWVIASHWSAEASAHWIPPQPLPLAGGEVSISFAAASLLGCWAPLPQRPPVRVTVCAGASVGGLWGAAHGFTSDSSALRPWVAAQLQARLSGRIAGPLGWTLLASPLVPFKPQSFSITGLPDGVAYRAAPAAFLGEAGLTLSSKP